MKKKQSINNKAKIIKKGIHSFKVITDDKDGFVTRTLYHEDHCTGYQKIFVANIRKKSSKEVDAKITEFIKKIAPKVEDVLDVKKVKSYDDVKAEPSSASIEGMKIPRMEDFE